MLVIYSVNTVIFIIWLVLTTYIQIYTLADPVTHCCGLRMSEGCKRQHLIQIKIMYSAFRIIIKYSY